MKIDPAKQAICKLGGPLHVFPVSAGVKRSLPGLPTFLLPLLMLLLALPAVMQAQFSYAKVVLKYS